MDTCVDKSSYLHDYKNNHKIYPHIYILIVLINIFERFQKKNERLDPLVLFGFKIIDHSQNYSGNFPGE
jgi:hypothetical protein